MSQILPKTMGKRANIKDSWFERSLRIGSTGRLVAAGIASAYTSVYLGITFSTRMDVSNNCHGHWPLRQLSDLD